MSSGSLSRYIDALVDVPKNTGDNMHFKVNVVTSHDKVTFSFEESSRTIQFDRDDLFVALGINPDRDES